MSSKRINPIYIKLNAQQTTFHDEISVENLFGLDPLSSNCFFAFEESYLAFNDYVEGPLERSDLVILDINNNNHHEAGFEVKLTAVPDNSTAHKDASLHSCELVFRPTAISHLALSIIKSLKGNQKLISQKIDPFCKKVTNWRSESEIKSRLPEFTRLFEELLSDNINNQIPFIINPIWRSIGKSNLLGTDCFDCFIWSNFAFTRLFMDSVASNSLPKITRQERCLAWTIKLLHDFSIRGKINTRFIVSEMSYERQSDKAFSITGIKSHKYLKSSSLEKPRIKASEIVNIILNGGENYLSPERRLDAAIVNSLNVLISK
jgi:hypothetical protein